MIPLDGTADLPAKHKAQLLEAIEQMQARDRSVGIFECVRAISAIWINTYGIQFVSSPMSDVSLCSSTS